MYLGITLDGPYIDLVALPGRKAAPAPTGKKESSKLFVGKGLDLTGGRRARRADYLLLAPAGEGQLSKALSRLREQLEEQEDWPEGVSLCYDLRDPAQQAAAQALGELLKKQGAGPVRRVDRPIAAAAGLAGSGGEKGSLPGWLLVVSGSGWALCLTLVRLGRAADGTLLAQREAQVRSEEGLHRRYLAQVITEAGGDAGRATERDLQRLNMLFRTDREKIAGCFHEYGREDLPGGGSWKAPFLCHGQLELTCAHLAAAGRKLLLPEARGSTRQMMGEMTRLGIPWEDRQGKGIRLVYEGQLQQNWLLQDYIGELLGLSALDGRPWPWKKNHSPASLGGALIAAGQAQVGAPAPWDLSVPARRADGSIRRDQICARGEVMVYGKIFPARCKGDKEPGCYLVSEKEPPAFGLSGRVVRAEPPCRESGKTGFCPAALGVSLETDGSLWGWAWEVDPLTGEKAGRGRKTLLANGESV